MKSNIASSFYVLMTVQKNEKHFEFLERKVSNWTSPTGRICFGEKKEYAMTWGNSDSIKRGTTVFLDKKELPLPYKSSIKKFFRMIKTSEKITFK